MISGTWWWAHRNRYWLIETKTVGAIKPRIIHLPLQHIKYVKLRHEIKIFNRLCLVMPCVNGVAVAYREQMRALLYNSQHRSSADPYERLLYGYACYVLTQKIKDEVKTRQLRRNLTFLLAPQRKIIAKRAVVWARRQYQFHVLPIYKIFKNSYFDPLQPGIVTSLPLQTVAHGSYVKYYNNDVIIKRYAQAYTLDAQTMQTVTLKVATDKSDFDCQINRGVVTCKHLPTGESHTYAVRGEHVRLATSLCKKTDALEIYITWQGQAKICLDGGQPKWLSQAEITINQRLERIVTAAYQSKFVTGERLRMRYGTAVKLVPSLVGLTRVIPVRNVDEFLQVWVQLDDYRQIARLFHGFSLVFLYSSTAPMVADTILATVSAEQITACHNDQLWVYLIDRTVTDPDALYYLTKLAQQGCIPRMTMPGGSYRISWPIPICSTSARC